MLSSVEISKAHQQAALLTTAMASLIVISIALIQLSTVENQIEPFVIASLAIIMVLATISHARKTSPKANLREYVSLSALMLIIVGISFFLYLETKPASKQFLGVIVQFEVFLVVMFMVLSIKLDKHDTSEPNFALFLVFFALYAGMTLYFAWYFFEWVDANFIPYD